MITETLLQEKIVAIVRNVPPARIPDVAEALLEGGIRCIEVTFDQRDAQKHSETLRSISGLRERFSQLLVGAGTVTTTRMAEQAVAAGAEYLISPNTDPAVIVRTKELGAVSVPGSLTPTEAMTAFHAGADIVKLFPAGVLGPEYIRAVCAPLNHIPFLAVGGLDRENISGFLQTGVSGFGIGGSLVNRQWIEDRQFDNITRLARELKEITG